MIRFIAILMLTLTTIAATPPILPRGTGEGSIGAADAYWATGSFKRIFIGGAESAPVVNGTTIGDYLLWNGTNWLSGVWPAVPQNRPVVGTNVLRFLTAWPSTNIWTNTVSTQLLFTAWGAGGAGYASGAGFVSAYWRGATGTVFEFVVSCQVTNPSTRSGPGSGIGIQNNLTTYGNGGGYSSIRIVGNTNYLVVAAGSGGIGGSAGAYGGPGGIYFSTTDGFNVGTNTSAGKGAYASDFYGTGATAGTNVTAANDTSANGSFLQGGNASTNGTTGGMIAYIGGGGGGWYGGAGATKTNSNPSIVTPSGGGGGLCYINSNLVTYGFMVAGETGAGGSPRGQDHPTYTSTVGTGGNNGTGNQGLIGVMW